MSTPPKDDEATFAALLTEGERFAAMRPNCRQVWNDIGALMLIVKMREQGIDIAPSDAEDCVERMRLALETGGSRTPPWYLNISAVTGEPPQQQAYIAVGLVAERSLPQFPDMTGTPSANFLAGLRSSREFVTSLQTMLMATLEQMEPELLKQISKEVSQLSKACDEVKQKLKAAKNIKPGKTVEKVSAKVSAKTAGGKRRKP